MIITVVLSMGVCNPESADRGGGVAVMSSKTKRILSGAHEHRATMEAKVEGYLRCYGVRICQGHGICYKVGSEYRTLIPSDASGADIGQKVQAHIRNKRLQRGTERRSPSYTAKEIGRFAKIIVIGAFSSSGPAFCCSVRNETELLYFCGCKNTQPMRSDNFRNPCKGQHA